MSAAADKDYHRSFPLKITHLLVSPSQSLPVPKSPRPKVSPSKNPQSATRNPQPSPVNKSRKKGREAGRRTLHFRPGPGNPSLPVFLFLSHQRQTSSQTFNIANRGIIIIRLNAAVQSSLVFPYFYKSCIRAHSCKHAIAIGNSCNRVGQII